MRAKDQGVNTGKPIRWAASAQPELREAQAGPNRVADRPEVALKRVTTVEPRGLAFKGNAKRGESAEIDVSLVTPESVRKLQRALYAKAKANPAYRFYRLVDKIHRKDVLQTAWHRCRANGGGPGVEGQSFAGIEHHGVEAWLDQLAQEVRTKTYRPQAVRRVHIPKPDGKSTRALGIPTIKDRVAQRWRRSSCWKRSLRRI